MGGDVITLEGEEPKELLPVISERFGLTGRVVDGAVLIEHPEGHLLVPRLVESFRPGQVLSVSLRRPTLADVFLKMTGHLLGADRPQLEIAGKRKRS
jgi:ABC-2 type transport system ATP-binding protein